MYIIDTSALIEYYDATNKGCELKSTIECAELAVSTLVLAELTLIYLKRNLNPQPYIQYILERGTIIPLHIEIAISGAVIKNRNKKKFSLADGIILATARYKKATLITCDTDFINESDALVY